MNTERNYRFVPLSVTSLSSFFFKSENIYVIYSLKLKTFALYNMYIFLSD